mmetsp:Transcript_81329/g.186020  ORF Transcript_81329/g.186020 Transcript_81329/m.186020 type:complete len:201 (-) Transcript_81329:28-630(-)
MASRSSKLGACQCRTVARASTHWRIAADPASPAPPSSPTNSTATVESSAASRAEHPLTMLPVAPHSAASTAGHAAACSTGTMCFRVAARSRTEKSPANSSRYRAMAWLVATAAGCSAEAAARLGRSRGEHRGISSAAWSATEATFRPDFIARASTWDRSPVSSSWARQRASSSRCAGGPGECPSSIRSKRLRRLRGCSPW